MELATLVGIIAAIITGGCLLVNYLQLRLQRQTAHQTPPGGAAPADPITAKLVALKASRGPLLPATLGVAAGIIIDDDLHHHADHAGSADVDPDAVHQSPDLAHSTGSILGAIWEAVTGA